MTGRAAPAELALGGAPRAASAAVHPEGVPWGYGIVGRGAPEHWSPTSALPGCWWTQPGFGPARTYANGGEDQLTAATIGDVVELWNGGALDQALMAGDTAPGSSSRAR